jgi:hypothetical protein
MSEMIPFSAEEQRLGNFQANPSLLYASDMSLRLGITRQMELLFTIIIISKPSPLYYYYNHVEFGDECRNRCIGS